MRSDLDTARRAVACSGWRLMTGMRICFDGNSATALRVVGLTASGNPVTARDPARSGERAEWARRARWLPDLTDPATLGCLLALVREAWGEPDAYACPATATPPGGWSVMLQSRRAGREPWGATEAAALVAALEATHAPE